MAKRFLITTSDERTWKKDEKILFLGEWCKRLSREELWGQLDYKVLPYHWDDRNRMLSDYQYLKDVYEKYLKILSENMNRVHGVNHSLKYWRIVIGPWLQLFVGIVFDKWLSLIEALKTEEITGTWVLDFGEEGMAPLGMREMQEFPYTDLWNHHIYSQVVAATHQIPFSKIELKSAHDGSMLYGKPDSNLKSMFKKVISEFGSLVPDRFNKVVLISNNFSKWDLIRLQISLGQVPCWLDPEIKLRDVSVHPGMRKDLETSVASSKFEKVLEKLIPANIPKLNVELYSKLCELALSRFPGGISSIVTTHGYWADDGVRYGQRKNWTKGLNW